MGYPRRRRLDYTAKDLKCSGNRCGDHCPGWVKELYEPERGTRHRAISIITMIPGPPPDGNLVPVGDKEYLVGEAQKMYRELSMESGEFFDFMIEHDLLTWSRNMESARADTLTTLPLYHATGPPISPTSTARTPM